MYMGLKKKLKKSPTKSKHDHVNTSKAQFINKNLSYNMVSKVFFTV